MVLYPGQRQLVILAPGASLLIGEANQPTKRGLLVRRRMDGTLTASWQRGDEATCDVCGEPAVYGYLKDGRIQKTVDSPTAFCQRHIPRTTGDSP